MARDVALYAATTTQDIRTAATLAWGASPPVLNDLAIRFSDARFPAH